jgi:hypothetical protein
MAGDRRSCGFRGRVRKRCAFAPAIRLVRDNIVTLQVRRDAKHQENQLEEEKARAEGAHSNGTLARAHLRNSVGAFPRRLLRRESKRQVGLDHRCRDAKISVLERPRRQRQNRRLEPSKAWPRLERRRCFSAEARHPTVAGEFRGACAHGTIASIAIINRRAIIFSARHRFSLTARRRVNSSLKLCGSSSKASEALTTLINL